MNTRIFKKGLQRGLVLKHNPGIEDENRIIIFISKNKDFFE